MNAKCLQGFVAVEVVRVTTDIVAISTEMTAT